MSANDTDISTENGEIGSFLMSSLQEEEDIQSTTVIPEPGLCVLTENEVGMSFFINLCKLSEIPAPPPIEESEIAKLIEDEDYTGQWKVPLSYGIPRLVMNQVGQEFYAVEVAVNSSWFEKTMVDSELFTSFVINSAMFGLCCKYGVALGTDRPVRKINIHAFVGVEADKCPPHKIDLGQHSVIQHTEKSYTKTDQNSAEKLSVIETKKRNFQECKKDLLLNLQEVRLEIEEKVVEKEEEYESHKRDALQMIELQAEEMSGIISSISRADDEIDRNEKEIQNIDQKIEDLEEERKHRLRKCKEIAIEKVNLDEQKKVLEEKSNCKLESVKKEGEELILALDKLKRDLKENIEAIKDLEGKSHTTATGESKQVPENANGFIDFLSKSIKKKEADLECPVCMEIAEAPIYMCQQMHLICSKCRPMLDVCPVCREEYQDMRRHRYAEETAGELQELREQMMTQNYKQKLADQQNCDMKMLMEYAYVPKSKEKWSILDLL